MISILATSRTVQATDLAKRVEAGDTTSFKGVLIPDWQWKKMNEDLIQKDILQKQLSEAPVPEKKSSLESLIWGILIGSSAVLLVEKFGSK